MNIFYLDNDPAIAAQYHHNVHVNKMILETAQMISTAWRVLDGDDAADKLNMYKLAHVNHPSTIWVRSGIHQYLWAVDLFTNLSTEFFYRGGKSHKTVDRITKALYDEANMSLRVPNNIDSSKPFTQPPLCMDSVFKISDDAVAAYRHYYDKDKRYDSRGIRMDKYTVRPRPYWFPA